MALKIALVLGGGGARGFAHLGVLDVFCKEEIHFDFIVGCSMGAVIGAGYAWHQDVTSLKKLAEDSVKSEGLQEIEKFFKQQPQNGNRLIFEKFENMIKKINFLNRIRKKWLFESQNIRDTIQKIIPEDLQFSDLKIPFACVGVDIFTGERIIFREGNVLDAILASSSIPGIFPPVKQGKRFIVDGGIVSQLPVEEAKILGADYVIAVDVGVSLLSQELQDGIDILLQCNKIMSRWLTIKSKQSADFVIHPEVNEISWYQFSQFDFCMKKGEQKALEKISDLKRSLRKKKLKSFFSPFSFSH